MGLLVLLIALNGCALQRIDDKVARNGRAIRELRGEIARLQDSLSRRGNEPNVADLKNELDQLINSSKNNSGQIDELKTSLMIFRSEMHGTLDVLKSYRDAALEKEREIIEAETKSISEYKDGVERERLALDKYAQSADRAANALSVYATVIETLTHAAGNRPDSSRNRGRRFLKFLRTVGWVLRRFFLDSLESW